MTFINFLSIEIIIKLFWGWIMEKHHKFSVWYVLLGIWLVLIAQQYLGAFFSIEVIPYSQFLNLLKENKITEVAISANQIQGKMKGEGVGGGKEKMFRSIRVDPETSKLLEQYNVNFKGEIESDFLPRLLSWIVPTAIFFGVWFFFMRRMMGQGAAEYSEATAELIDDEVREIINTQYARVSDILREKKQFLEKAAHVLLEKEKIDGEELKALMAENSLK